MQRKLIQIHAAELIFHISEIIRSSEYQRKPAPLKLPRLETRCAEFIPARPFNTARSPQSPEEVRWQKQRSDQADGNYMCEIQCSFAIQAERLISKGHVSVKLNEKKNEHILEKNKAKVEVKVQINM